MGKKKSSSKKQFKTAHLKIQIATKNLSKNLDVSTKAMGSELSVR